MFATSLPTIIGLIAGGLSSWSLESDSKLILIARAVG